MRGPASRSAGRAAARAAFRIAGVLAAAALTVVAAPASRVAGGGAAAAWLAGWPPGRLYRAALWCVPMLVVWLAATAIATRSASQVAEAPYLAWLAMWHRGAAGSYPAAAAVIAPPAIPAGLAAGGLCWAYRIRLMETGSGGLAPDSAAGLAPPAWRRPGARARGRRPVHRDLAGRGRPVAVGAAARAAHHHAGRPGRARHRLRCLLRRRHGGGGRAGRAGARRAPRQHRGLPRPAGPRLAHDRLRIRPSPDPAGPGPLGGPPGRRHRACGA